MYSSMTKSSEALCKPPFTDASAATSIPPIKSSTVLSCVPDISFGLRRPGSKAVVVRLCAMFTIDAFAGAFVMQTWIAFWFQTTWGVRHCAPEAATPHALLQLSPSLIGYLIMCANVVAGLSGVAAARCVSRFGAMNTMLFSHFPSNILLLLVPFMPDPLAAAAMLVARFCISQMDVPARNTYVMLVVASDERSAAGGITNIVRSIGMCAAPPIVGWLSSHSVGSGIFNSPWMIAGSLKCVYDVLLYALYRINPSMAHAEEASATLDGQEAEAAASLPTSIRQRGGANTTVGGMEQPLLSDQDHSQ
jgi:MFS family permease